MRYWVWFWLPFITPTILPQASYSRRISPINVSLRLNRYINSILNIASPLPRKPLPRKPNCKNAFLSCERKAFFGMLQSKKCLFQEKKKQTLTNLLYVRAVLFSRAVSSQVFSPLMSLTTVFGMGTGVPSSP